MSARTIRCGRFDQFVDLSGLREHLRPFYSRTRRPSVASHCRSAIIGHPHDLGIWLRKLIGDTGYRSAEMFVWLVDECVAAPLGH